MEVSLRTFAAALLLTTAAAAQNRVAVLPLEPRPGALSAADAVALTEELRTAARDALAGHGYEVVAGQGNDVQAAMESSGAVAAVLGRAAEMEGATVIGLGVYKAGSSAPAARVRVMGIGIAQLKADLRAKVPGAVTSALGLTPAVPEPKFSRGTLKMPVPVAPAPPEPAAQPRSEPGPQAQPPQNKPRARPPPPPGEDPLVTLIRETTLDVEDLRGLRRKQNLKVQILDDKLFSAAVKEKAKKEMTADVVAAERARWLAFNLAPAAADPAQVLLDVLDEQVAGFYDPFTKQLIVRKDPPQSAAAEGPEGFRLVLAHEIEHALQDQNFGIPDLASLPNDDVRLARSALYEGDAMAVMAAYGAQRAGKPVKAAIASSAATLRAVDTQTLLRVSGRSPQLLHAPPVLREELVLPYAGGFALVAEAYKRGGFALVDKMFKNPPVSTHQVLHPEAYFAGVRPAPVPPPQAPRGTRVVASGRMGELGTRVALESCVDKEVAREFAPRWAGDAYTVVEGPEKGALSLLWTTAWSSGVAGNVSNLMKLVQPCWQEQAAAGPNPLGWSIGGASKIAVSAELVGVARGSVDLAAALSRQLAVRILPPAPAPPFGDLPATPAVARVRFDGARFTSARLALSGEVPEGYESDSSNPVAEVAIKKAGAGGAALSFVAEPLAGDALDAFFQAASAQIAAANGGYLVYAGKSQRMLAGAPAEQRSWSVENAGVELRIDVAPYCGGKAALTLLRLEAPGAARAMLDRFAASLQQTGTPPACADLE
jgi:hypothetical protein